MGNEKLAGFINRITETDKFIIYCAGEFASLVVQYCLENKMRDKIECCAVTKVEPNDNSHLLGVPIFEYSKIEKSDKLIIVAVLNERVRQEILGSLNNDGLTNVYAMSKDEYNALKETVVDFSIRMSWQLDCIKKQFAEQITNLSSLVYDNILLTHNNNLVSETHKRTFGKYKDINKGKTVVVCGTGPSLAKYKFNPDFVHIGVNTILLQDKIKLDYYFCQHIPQSDGFPGGEAGGASSEGRNLYLESLKRLKCVKFIGQVFNNAMFTTPPFGEISNGNYETYYPSSVGCLNQIYCADIRYGMLIAGNVIFPALQFALFTNPSRIYIVGCDGYSAGNDNYYSKEANDYYNSIKLTDKEQFLTTYTPQVLEMHKNFKLFADMSYPNTEVVMVNPVQFKGIYKETDTDEFGNIKIEY